MHVARIKPAEGQLSLLPGVPPVQYCRDCGRSLTGDVSRERGRGPTCWRRSPEGKRERRRRKRKRKGRRRRGRTVGARRAGN